jgi:hypothetical protein
MFAHLTLKECLISIIAIAELAIIESAFRLLEDRTRVENRDCIKFVPRTTELIYLRIHVASGCWSYVGRQIIPGAQLLSLQKPLTPGGGHCVHKGTVAHELMHALGFYHEQSRFDRDNYVKINFENIQSGTENNFNKYNLNQANYSTPYDLASIMHYEWNAFSVNGLPTVVPLPPNENYELVNAARKPDITDYDAAEIRKFYQCS